MSSTGAEYSIGGEKQSMSIEMGSDNAVESVSKAPTTKVEFDTDDLSLEKDRAETQGEDTEGVEPKGEDTKEDGGEESPSLPDTFNPEDPEVVAAFDSKYTTESGELDFEGSLSAEFFENLEAGKEGLNEATYEYLASKGIPKSTVKQVEAMAVTQRDAEKQSVQAHDSRLFELAGGPDALSKALEWGKKGGYSPEQQKRFNEITSGSDLVAKEEAVEALMARYRRANPGADKPKLPKRDATKGQGKVVSGVKPFKDRSEMREVRSKLRDNDTKGWAAFRARLAVSNFKD